MNGTLTEMLARCTPIQLDFIGIGGRFCRRAEYAQTDKNKLRECLKVGQDCLGMMSVSNSLEHYAELRGQYAVKEGHFTEPPSWCEPRTFVRRMAARGVHSVADLILVEKIIQELLCEAIAA